MGIQISAVTLAAWDLERSKRFYERLGCEVDEDHPGFVSFKMGDASTYLSLYGREALADDAGVPSEGGGFTGVVLSYIVKGDQVDEVLRQAEQAGGTIVKKGQKAQWGGYFGYFSDPDGYLWKVTGY